MRKRVLLLGVLSVAVALTASGCFGGLIADIVGGLTEEIAIEAAVKAFLEAWDQGSAESMKSQLAPIVTFHPELFGESANPESSDDVVAGLLAPEEDRQVVEVELGGSVEALRTGDEATASAKVRVKYELDIDAELKALPGDEDSLYVEDIYPMAFGLIKDGSGWKINYLNIKTGTRTAAIFESWATFAEGIVEGDVDAVLSVTTDPSLWGTLSEDDSKTRLDVGGDGLLPLDGLYAHAQLRTELEDIFATTDILRFELSDVRAAYLDAEDGLFYGLLEFDSTDQGKSMRLDAGTGGELLAFHATYDEDKWKLESIQIVLSE